MELSQKLKELRKEQGLTQLELAKKLFVSRQAITGWEAGTSRPSTESLQSLSELYHVPLEILLDDAAEIEPEPEKIPAAERPEEKREPERGKDRTGRRYKLFAVIAVLLAFLLGMAAAALAQRSAGQGSSEVLTFDEMDSRRMDITDDITEVPLIGFD